jgi:hypothetical protein
VKPGAKKFIKSIRFAHPTANRLAPVGPHRARAKSSREVFGAGEGKRRYRRKQEKMDLPIRLIKIHCYQNCFLARDRR